MRLAAGVGSLGLVFALGAAASPSTPHARVTIFTGELNAVSAQSPSDAWAVGDVNLANTLILRWNGTTWAKVPSPNREGNGGGNNVLSGVSAVTASDAWAVGNVFYGQPDIQKTLIERWNGTGWSLVRSPNPGPGPFSLFDALSAVSALSPSNVWAAGQYSGANAEKTLIVHWNGTSWAKVASPGPGFVNNDVQLTGLSASSPTNIWAAGYYFRFSNTIDNNEKTFVLRWNGTRWARVASPNPGGTKSACCQPDGSFLLGVSALSTSTAWAVGYYQTSGSSPQKTMILRWNGTTWTKVPSPNPGGANGSSLAGVSAVSPTNAWAVGSYVTKTSSTLVAKTLILHWNGTTWAKVASPNPPGGGSLTAVTALSSTDAWAVGSYFAGSTQKTLILHWNGTSWTRS